MAYRIILSIIFLLNTGCTPLVGALLKKQQDASTDTPVEGTPYCENTPQCPGGNYCRIEPCGAMVGFCTKIPTLCEPDFVPVCGCDGVTYDNFCKLTMAQKAKDHDGPCNTAECSLDNPGACGEGYFCDGPCDGSQNRCVFVADVCGTAEPMPVQVCGCDGVTYNDDCDRILDGRQRLDHPGPCDVSSCNEGDAVTCGEGMFCEGFPGMCYTGTPGWCQPLSSSCDLTYDPVCGCDDVTYDNDCMRQASGVWQKYWGPCTGTICELDLTSGNTQGTCDFGFFCELPPGACSPLITPAGLAQGVCVQDWNCDDPLLPCRETDTPVCGCDGFTTYENDCARRGAGVNVGCCDPCGDVSCLLDEV